MQKKAWSWGNYPLAEHRVTDLQWRDEDLPSIPDGETQLPYGNGRSYGDVPLNDGGTILRTSGMSRFIHFDAEAGILKCESGVTLESILNLIVPHGWFLAVTPGTQLASIGGAVANDVHGKNHHSAGTFGEHIIRLEMLRSDQGHISCSREENADLFSATIGGLGLTGLILTVEIKLLKIHGRQMDVENIAFPNIEAGLSLFEQYDETSTYTVAWIDCLSQGEDLGRGIFTRAEHSEIQILDNLRRKKVSVPFYFPSFVLNKWTIKAFNEAYYRKGKYTEGSNIVDYQPFFYPLDTIDRWNKIYGKKGFLQYQCVVPNESTDHGIKNIKKLLAKISQSGAASFLAVLKRFGDRSAPGLLSFPRAGITLALDFPNKGAATFSLLESLDTIVRDCGGRVYPAKDARMSAESFSNYYPDSEHFASFIDPTFSSSFWRRVTGDNK